MCETTDRVRKRKIDEARENYDEVSSDEGIDPDCWKEQGVRINEGLDKARGHALEAMNDIYVSGSIQTSIGSVVDGVISIRIGPGSDVGEIVDATTGLIEIGDTVKDRFKGVD